MKKLVVDLDDIISVTIGGDYVNSKPVIPVINMLNEYKKQGFEIIIYSSRNMRTYEENVGKINIYTLPNIIDWLRKYNILFARYILENHSVVLMVFILMIKLFVHRSFYLKITAKLLNC